MKRCKNKRINPYDQIVCLYGPPLIDLKEENHKKDNNFFAWTCRVCNTLNEPENEICKKCGTNKFEHL